MGERDDLGCRGRATESPIRTVITLSPQNGGSARPPGSDMEHDVLGRLDLCTRDDFFQRFQCRVGQHAVERADRLLREGPSELLDLLHAAVHDNNVLVYANAAGRSPPTAPSRHEHAHKSENHLHGRVGESRLQALLWK